MKLIELATPGDLGELLARSQQPHRSEGIHVSECIRHIENAVTKKGQRPPRNEMSAQEIKRMGGYTPMGFIWEQLVRDALAKLLNSIGGEEFVSPGELEMDGITGTPDRLDIANEAIEETKATWRSSRRPLEQDFWSWFVQIKSYCHMAGVSSATLPVFFVNGNYRESGPQMKKWYMEFDKKELEENWEMIKSAAEEIRNVG